MNGIDQQRARWREFRDRLRLTDTTDKHFGNGGLASLLDQPTVRLVILPCDPAAETIDFDEVFWDWFDQDLLDPAAGQKSRWGGTFLPTSGAAVRMNGDAKHRNRCLALHRNGGLELAMGREARFPIPGDTTAEGLNMIVVVGRLWCALEQYRDVVATFTPKGPWEVALALTQVGQLALGEFADGWERCDADGQWKSENHLRVIEFDNWPDSTGIQELAFRLGGWIENCWGSRLRRYLAGRGPNAGGFDRSKYWW